MESISHLLYLLYPPTCLICREPGESLCRTCDYKIMRPNRCCQIGKLTIWSGALYGDELAKVIVAAKDQNSAPARNILVQMLFSALTEAYIELDIDAGIALIPIPSSPSANRRRGFRHAFLLSKALAHMAGKKGNREIRFLELLRVNRKVVDQSALNRAERIQNVGGAYSAHTLKARGIGQARQSVCFLVDDLITTGSTVLEGERALKEAGISVVGALCAGVSPRLIT